jgi:hypothetical protein
MHIIFGNDQSIEEARKKYLVLQLETLSINGEQRTAYCVVQPESIPVDEVSDLPRLKELHLAIVEAWNRQDYDTVLFGLPHVRGKFGSELDSFYLHLSDKIASLQAIQAEFDQKSA